ncbi:MAG TPA: polyprenyl synthetase family protein [Candidatus Limnocylindrales bacterium]
MRTGAELRGPFPFYQTDLEPDRLAEGVRHTLEDFRRWRERRPDLVTVHVGRYEAALAAVRHERSPAVRAGLLLAPRTRRALDRARLAREVVHFGVYNLAELIPQEKVEAFSGSARRVPRTPEIIAAIDDRRGALGIVEAFEARLPVLRGVPEMRWLAERLDRLYRILPEPVIRGGSMGKVVRTLTGVLLIGAYDTADADLRTIRAHLARILTGAYALGAAYAIVDDTLLDLPAERLDPAEREQCHRLVLRGLGGESPVAEADLPDHPLAEEAHLLHGLMLEAYPFAEYRHLYQAAESMYRAQHRDAGRFLADAATTELPSMYPDLFVKAGMSRVVANIMGRRQIPDGFYRRCLNTILLSQLRDDLLDEAEDRADGRLTPFTHPGPLHGISPLDDVFAYNAYVAYEVYGGDEAAAEAFAHYGAVRLARHLSADPRRATRLLERYPVPAETAAFIRSAARLPERAARAVDVSDQRLKARTGRIYGDRPPAEADCRTFVADRLPYLREVTARHTQPANATELSPIVQYGLGGQGGKRLRPALTLMLAVGLGVDPATIEPVLAASELFHTSSLMFDDLPAQDNATLRRGRPAAHTVFDEAGVQLAALSMVSSGFGLLARLREHYPAERVAAVIGYVGTVLGPERLCRGQYLDLRLGRDAAPVTGDGIVEMYALKTSTAMEAALVPLMMLLDRPEREVELVGHYAHHAGIVFQIRDDILDATGTAEVIGKDVGHDAGKVNLVRVYGITEAELMLQRHLTAAGDALRGLPFDTRLLHGMVQYFANRRK